MSRDQDNVVFEHARDEVTVGDLREWHYLKIRCETCKHEGRFTASALQRRFSEDRAIADLAPRFRCKNCGKLGSKSWDVWQINRNA